MRQHRTAALLTPSLLSACTGVQSALAPQGPEAAQVAVLSWVMFAGAALILALVSVLAALAVFAPARVRGWLGDRRVVVWGGIAFPVVVLTALLVYGLWVLGTAAARTATPGGPVIEVTGEQWWWRVRYLDAEGRPLFETANEVRLPVGRTVEFRLRAADVIHSFWVPVLGGKLDMIPGRENVLRLRADAPGTFRGQCAEYCGGPHALMAFGVVAMESEAFQGWMDAQARPAAEPAGAEAARGRELFLGAGCGACHVVRGTPAAGALGPDLTHVGGRESIGAGLLPTHRGTLAGWIAGSQAIKPGNRMPDFNTLPGEDLRALALWLEGLK